LNIYIAPLQESYSASSLLKCYKTKEFDVDEAKTAVGKLTLANVDEKGKAHCLIQAHVE